MNESMSAENARGMLQQADQLGASARTGAGWPQITMLLGIGAISSLSLISFGLAARISDAAVTVPLIAMMIWLGIFMATGLFFGRSVKKGFGPRWITYIAIWGVLWVLSVSLGGFVFQDQMWFYVLCAALIAVVTTACSWYEARR
ncbi:hypothetical protein [Arthrobacter roseus]|uniref:hypothetical protein n=1 Tax=Arthrobacter roseus TaxID=136274 RepID=UPI0019643D18|nr:hypothetical protein [Arthrobacter roseus]MBM7847910.1 hypothetical protein [Arthrobacter roseus]